MAERRHVKLAFAVYNQGVAEATAWQLPSAALRWTTDRRFLRDVIRTAERGLFDYFFIPSILSSSSPADIAGNNDPFRIDPMPLASYAAALTDRIGLAVTFNTTYEHPFDVARATASLDHLSGGRAAVNLVMGAANSDAARNYGDAPHPETDEKYDRAEEFVELLFALWGSWPSDAIIGDRAGGRLLREGVGGAVNYRGRFYSVEGGLTVPPPLQGRLPIIHAGVSERSREFGARFADIRFASFSDLAGGREQYADIKRRVAAEGRDPESYYVIPGLTVYTDETRAGARAIFRAVQEASRRELPSPRAAQRLGIDLDRARPQDRILDVVPEVVLADSASLAGRAIAAWGDADLSLADLAHYEATEAKGQPALVGSPTDVADWIEEAFLSRALDGIKFYPPYLPGPLDAFVSLVVPELQRRGLARSSYESAVFREQLGLAATAGARGSLA